MELRTGEDWRTAVRRAIEASDVVVFVATTSSIRSELCLEELRHASELGRRVIPLVYPGVAPAGLPLAERPVRFGEDMLPELLNRIEP